MRVPPLAPGTRRVLVVEDHEDLREVFALAFLQAGFEVERARDGLEAFERIVKNPPDLLVTDLIMPGLDGFSLIRSLRHRRATQRLPILAVTAQADAEVCERVARCGGCGCLVKPCQLDVLVQKARQLLDCHSEYQSWSQRCPRSEMSLP